MDYSGKRLLHTPEGVRDIYGDEKAARNIVEHLLQDKIKSYGYQDIQTPTFEFFDVFFQRGGDYAFQRAVQVFLTKRAIRLCCGPTLRRRSPDARPNISWMRMYRSASVIGAIRLRIPQTCRAN